MSFDTYDESTKSLAVYIIMPKRVLLVEPRPKNPNAKIKEVDKKLIMFEKSLKQGLKTYYYKLPGKGVALEEYEDYLVVNVGINADERLFGKVIEIATSKNKGLILKPPMNIKHLYLMDKIVEKHNELNGHESVRY